MNFSDILALLSSNWWLYVGAFILVLSVLVFVHEWGHYIVARLCRVRVETFSIGFGPELWGRNDRRGTRWKISAVPLGGYVKLFGDVDPSTLKPEEQKHYRPISEAERPMTYFSKKVWQRAAIVAAGPAINYLFAIVVLAGLFMMNGRPVTPPMAGGIVSGSAAQEAGFRPQDLVLSVDGKAINDFDDLRREMMIGLDTLKTFKIQRGEDIITLQAKPRVKIVEDRFGFKHSLGFLGLISPQHALLLDNILSVNGTTYRDQDSLRKALHRNLGKTVSVELKGAGEKDAMLVALPADQNTEILDPNAKDANLVKLSAHEGVNYVRYAPLQAVGKAVEYSWVVTRGTLEALGQIVVGTRSPTELGGVIRIGALAGDMAQQGLVAFIFFAALLSINLGLINLLPIPMLDGGYLVFYAAEAAMGRPVPDYVQEYAFRAGLVFLVGIMVYANLNDIMQMIL